MSIVLVANTNPTVTPGAPTTTQTFPYTPASVNNLLQLLPIATTASRVLNTVTSSGITWNVTNSGTTVALNSTTHCYSVGGVVNTAALQTVTMTFSATPGTVTCGIAEWDPTIGGLVGFTFITSTTSNGSSTTALTLALTGGQIGDVFLNNAIVQNTITGNSNVQGYLTYDDPNGVIYGQLTTAATVPATGFTQTTGLWYMPALLYRPTIVTPSSGPVPFISGYSGMFYHKDDNDSGTGFGDRSASERKLQHRRPGRPARRVRGLDSAGLRWGERRGGVRIG